MNRSEEPILTEDMARYCQLPIKYPAIQDMFKVAEAAFWSAGEIDYSADLNDWETLSKDEQYFIEHILAFFSQSDMLINENLGLNFYQEVKIPEAKNFYAFQMHMENTHSITYAMLIETFIKDAKQKKKLFNAIETIPCVTKKANWTMKWFNRERPFEERLIAFSVIEGVFFSGSFCAIFWLKSRNKMTKALGKSNELISRDESLHTEFAVLLYHHLVNKVSQERVEEIFKEAVEIEEEFICESLPCKLIGMNSDLMRQYIKYVADRLLVQLGFNKIYNCDNPFDFMKTISLDGKTNFFEQRVSEYTAATTIKNTEDTWNFDDDEEF